MLSLPIVGLTPRWSLLKGTFQALGEWGVWCLTCRRVGLGWGRGGTRVHQENSGPARCPGHAWFNPHNKAVSGYHRPRYLNKEMGGRAASPGRRVV